MTSLSWLIYAISTIANLSVFLGIVLFVCGTLIGGLAFAGMMNWLNDDYFPVIIIKWITRILIGATITGFVMVFIPQKEYLVMIAGAEVANVALNQDAVKQAGSQFAGLSSDAVSLLRLYIQKETENLQNDKKKD